MDMDENLRMLQVKWQNVGLYIQVAINRVSDAKERNLVDMLETLCMAETLWVQFMVYIYTYIFLYVKYLIIFGMSR